MAPDRIDGCMEYEKVDPFHRLVPLIGSPNLEKSKLISNVE